MFDLDSTLVYPVGAHSGPNNGPNNGPVEIPEYVIRGLKNISQYPIVIFTNQLGLSLGKCKLHDITSKIECVVKATGINPYVFIATENDKYRKPHVGMFKLFVKKYLRMRTRDAIAAINMMFCGDAAGRGLDFSDSDRKFALNCGIDFITPEVFFKIRDQSDEEEKYSISGFNPVMYIESINKCAQMGAKMMPISGLRFNMYEMIIMVGPPGCGKSTFVARELYGYVRVNQDTLKSRQKCLKVAADACKYGLNIVIDNTNPSASVRKEYINIALGSKYKYTINCVYMNVGVDLAQHLSALRVEYSGKNIPNVAYGRYLKSFEYPTLKEGFNTINVVDFAPNFNKKQLKKFTRWY
jgi:bifunctional polynucleotide phosphatase/kinase